LLTVAIAVSACSSKKSRPADDAAPPDKAPAPVADAAPALPAISGQPPMARASTEALWKLAPEPVKFGAVVADGGFEALGASAGGLAEILALDPRGAVLWSEWTGRLRDSAGFDVADVGRWRAAGLDPRRGGALFGTTGSDAAMILPVGDGDRFRATFAVIDREIAGRQLAVSPVLGYCAEAGDRYACADSVELLDAVIAGAPGDLARRALALPDALRGSVEIVADLGAFPGARERMRDLEPALTGGGLLAIGARLGGGRLTAEIWLAGQRAGPVGEAFRKLGKPASLQPHLGGATGVVAAHLPLRELLGLADLAPIGLGGATGVDLNAVLTRRLTGQVALITRGAGLVAGVAIAGLDDATGLRAAMPEICRLVRRMTDEPTTAAPRRCRTAIGARAAGLPPLPGLPPALQRPIPLEISAATGAVQVEIGEAAASPGAAPAFALEPAHFLSWGRSLDPWATAPLIEARLGAAAIAARLDADQRARLALARRLANHVFEAGVRARLDADGIRASIELVSFAADPAHVYAAYRVAVNRLLGGDHAGYRRQLEVLAHKHPDTLVADQAAMVARGTPAIGPGTALYAAIAIRSALKYTAR
jgi:hypothetical protein